MKITPIVSGIKKGWRYSTSPLVLKGSILALPIQGCRIVKKITKIARITFPFQHFFAKIIKI